MPYDFEEILSRVRANDPALNHLDLIGKRLTGENIIRLCSALATNTTLTSLNVSDNDIGAAGAQALAANTTLTSLNVSDNDIGAAGAQALAANTTLTSLDVGQNHIGDAGARALADNATLTSLDVGGNQIGDAGAQALAANTTLTSLGVSGCDIGDIGAQALAANSSLSSLNVCDNDIGDVGAQALAANTTLTSLNARFNTIGDAVLVLLTEAIIRNIDRNIDAKKSIVALHAFASIAHEKHGPKFLPADIAEHIGSFLITGTALLNEISQRAFVRSSRHMFFQPAGPDGLTMETIQPAPTHG